MCEVITKIQHAFLSMQGGKNREGESVMEG